MKPGDLVVTRFARNLYPPVAPDAEVIVRPSELPADAPALVVGCARSADGYWHYVYVVAAGTVGMVRVNADNVTWRRAFRVLA